MNKTSIGWTDYSSNPIYVTDKATGKRGWHCVHVSAECTHCYAEVLNKRWGTGGAYVAQRDKAVDWCLSQKELQAWRDYEAAVVASKKPPALVFVGDMLDIFHPDVPLEFLVECLNTMAACPHMTFQLLTKRAARMRAVLTAWLKGDGRCLPNVWAGASIGPKDALENLVRTPATVHFVSAEPLLGLCDLQLEGRNYGVDYPDWSERIDWVIAGAESGPHRRPYNEDWARALRDECQAAGVAYYYKQGSDLYPGKHRLLDGRTWDEFPQQAVAA